MTLDPRLLIYDSERAVTAYLAAIRIYEGTPTDATWRGLCEALDRLTTLLARQRTIGKSLHQFHNLTPIHGTRGFELHGTRKTPPATPSLQEILGRVTQPKGAA